MSLPALGEGKSKLSSGSFSSKERNVWFERPDFFSPMKSPILDDAWDPNSSCPDGTDVPSCELDGCFRPRQNFGKGFCWLDWQTKNSLSCINPVHSIPFIRSFVRFIHSFIHSFIPSFLPSFLHSFIHSFIIYKQNSLKQPPSIWAVKLIAKSSYNISESLVIQLLKSKSLISFADLWSMQKSLYRN